MRRLVLVPLFVVGIASAFALGGNAAPTVRTTRAASGTGTIKLLDAGTITVHSAFDLTCKLTGRSPATATFSVGDHVKVVCAGGVLVRIRAAVSHPGSPPNTNLSDERTRSTASGIGLVTTLTTSSIGVTGDRTLTCTVGAGSPALGDYHLGDRVKIGCVDGVLYVIVRIADTPSPTTTTTAATAPSTNAYGFGAISALTSSSITITGDASLSCSLGEGSPRLGDFQIGERVKIACRNGVLVAIVAADTTGSQTTTTTAATTTTTPTTTTSTNAYGFGTISALSGSGITVTGDRSLSCAITGDSPPVGDYHLGDAVKIGCRNGVLYGIVESASATTATSTTTTTTSNTTNTYLGGTVTALSSTSVTVTGTSSALTCEVAPNGPSPAAYGFKVGDHLTIACQNGVLTHVSTV